MFKIMRMRPCAMKDDGRLANRILSLAHFVPSIMYRLVRIVRDMTDLYSKIYCAIVFLSFCKTNTYSLVSHICTASTGISTGN